MAFPDERLPLIIEIAPGADLTQDPDTWPWVDVTRYWRNRTEITITEGRGDWGEAIDAGTCTITFDNREGHFSEHNPRGQWYGLLGRDTPLRVSLDRPSGRVVIWGGFVPAWVPSWDMSGKDRTVTVTAHGVLYRLRPVAGKPPALSPMRRTIAASGPVAYWPCEDGTISTQAASAVPGVPAMTVTGAIRFAPVDQINVSGDGGFARIGTVALADLAGGGSLTGILPPSATAATTAAWTVHCFARVSPASSSGPIILMEWDTPGGTFVKWQLGWKDMPSGGGYAVVAYRADGSYEYVVDHQFYPTSSNVYDVSAWQDGGTIRIGHQWWGNRYLDTASFPGTLAGITAIRINPTREAIPGDEMPVGHIAIWGQVPHPYRSLPEQDEYGEWVDGAIYTPYLPEAAHLRLARLCAEDGIPVEMPEVTDARGVTRMGDQPVATLHELLQQCEAADGGVLYERPFRLAYTPRVALYNQDPALVLDWSAGDLGAPPEPDPYNQRYRNRYEVKRTGGSSAIAERPDVHTGIIHGESVELNLATDDAVMPHAAWRLHLASHTGLRWPRLELNLIARPDYIDDWLACRVGSRIQALNPPDDVAGQEIDLMLEGWTLTLGPYTFRVVANCSPYTPWLVGRWSISRYDSRDSALAAPVDESATTLDISFGELPWTTDPAALPLDLAVGGERVTVTAISAPVGNTQTMTVARGVNGIARSWPAGTRVRLWRPAIYAL